MPFHVTYRQELELLTYATPTHAFKYRVFQIYGQKYVKIMEPEMSPDAATEVFAANLPRDIHIVTLFTFFAKCGEICQLRLLMDFSGSNRGKCFVQYRDVLASREAICCLHDEEIAEGHRIAVKLSLNNNQLILKSVPDWIGPEAMRDIVTRTIGEGLVGFSMRRSRVPLKNYCFCTYRDHQFAVMAHKKSWPFMNILGAVVDVHWAVPALLRFNTKLYFTLSSHDITKNEFFGALIKIIDVRTLVQFRIVQCFGFIMFANYNAMVKAEGPLQTLTIRGAKVRFSRYPFKSSDGCNRSSHISVSYYNQKTVSMTLPPRTVPVHPFALCGFHSQSVPNQPSPFPANGVYMPHVLPFPTYPYHNAGYVSLRKQVTCEMKAASNIIL